MINVAIVEDEIRVRRSLIELISSTNKFNFLFETDTAEDALEKILNKQIPDILLLDIELKGNMTGIELTQLLKKITNKTHIIMLTQFDDRDNVYNALCHGASAYLLKGGDFDDIIDVINVVLNGGAVISPGIAEKVLKLFSKYQSLLEDSDMEDLAKELLIIIKEFYYPNEEYDLNKTEEKILSLLVDGTSNKNIAKELLVTEFNIYEQIKLICHKLQLHSQLKKQKEQFKEYLFLKEKYNLTMQQIKVVILFVNGIYKKMIADKLHIVESTVGEHFKEIYKKMDISSQQELIIKVLRETSIP